MKTSKNEKLGFSISDRRKITMEPFVENGINYLEVRLLEGNNKEKMQSFINEALTQKQKLGFKIKLDTNATNLKAPTILMIPT